MWDITLSEVIEATGGKLLFGRPNGIKGISIDSRSIKEGELFIALKGERFDGHDFLADALVRGCCAVVSIPPASPATNKTIIHVSNTLKALQDIAHYIRKKSGIPVVGITGTNGKTTTKEMAAAILETRYKVLKSSGNLNNQVGVPLSIFQLAPNDEVAVLEMGASAPGDIRELCDIASPGYGVLTNIGHAHIEGFKDIGAVRQAKMELLHSVRKASVNADDEFMMEGLQDVTGVELVRFGKDPSNDVFATEVDCGERACTFMLHVRDLHVPVTLGVTGMFNVYNALAAASVGLMFGLDIEEMKQGLERFEGVPMRLEIKALGGATVISDVYNANPASMEEALKELLRLRKGRAVAVLGDMLELGSYAEAAHRRLGSWMARQGVDLFIAVGPLMAIAAEEYRAEGGREALTAGDALEARTVLLEQCRESDTVLVKGSRSMQMERVVEGNPAGMATTKKGG